MIKKLWVYFTESDKACFRGLNRCAAISIDELDFSMTYDCNNKEWTASWKWRNGHSLGELSNSVQEYTTLSCQGCLWERDPTVASEWMTANICKCPSHVWDDVMPRKKERQKKRKHGSWKTEIDMLHTWSESDRKRCVPNMVRQRQSMMCSTCQNLVKHIGIWEDILTEALFW